GCQVRAPLGTGGPGMAQGSHGAVGLAASEARCHGDQLQCESGAERDNLGFWMSPADWADWEFKITKTGKFELSAEIAAPAPASLEVSVGEQKIKGAAPVTGDYGKFTRVSFGTVQLGSPGKVTVAVHAVPEGWHPVNLKTL